MLATIPVNELAETLRVLAGGNASSAARHFTKRSHDIGDVAGVVLWTTIAEMLARLAAPAPAEERAVPPIPQRMKQLLEATAFEGVWFEDVDAEVLFRERQQETLIPECVTPPSSQDAPVDGEREEARRLPLAA